MTPDSFSLSPDPITAVQRAHRASIPLGMTKGALRNQAVRAMAQALKQQQDDILEANTLDLEASREMAVPDLILEWLKLTPERIQTIVQTLQQLSEVPDPIGRIMSAAHQIDHCQTYSQLMPLGVVALVYEALPELGALAAGLAIKTGNSVILRGGSEASHSNLMIAQVLHRAIESAGLPDGCFYALASEGASVRDLVTQDLFLNLVIPYGRPSLVQQILRQATAPVLKTAMGNCYLYWSPSGSLDATRWMILDSHQSEPDPVNAIEKVLIHRHQNPSSLTMLWNSLRDKGFEIRGDAELVNEFPDLRLVSDSTEWRQAYLAKTVAFKVVDSIEAAITWINLHSSGHADCLVTESYQESRQFALGLNSASTYINASPRFSRNSRRGDSIFLGMSNHKGLRRGFISLETLTTVKQIVQGSGQF